MLIWTIAGFYANQIFAYFPVWSGAPNSGDPQSSFQWVWGDVHRFEVETVALQSQTLARIAGIQLCAGIGNPATYVWLDRPGRIAGAPSSMRAVIPGTSPGMRRRMCLCVCVSLSPPSPSVYDEEEAARVKCVTSTMSWPHSSCWL